MGTVLVNRVRGVGLLAGAVLALAAGRAEAQAPDSVHRMEINNGISTRSYYFAGQNLSEGERIMLRDLQRTENEVGYSRDLLALRRQYVDSDRLLEPQRRAIQEQLYGNNITATGFGGYGVGYGDSPYGYVPPFVAAPFNYGGYAFGYGYGAPAVGLSSGPYFGVGAGSSVTRTLAVGVGDEGRLKDALAATVAQQATPEYAQAAMRSYNTAVARAAESSGPIRAVLGIPGKPGTGIAEAGSKDRPPVMVTLKGGDKIPGTSLKEDGDWYVVDSYGDMVRVRKSEVLRIDTRDKKSKPESDK